LLRQCAGEWIQARIEIYKKIFLAIMTAAGGCASGDVSKMGPIVILVLLHVTVSRSLAPQTLLTANLQISPKRVEVFSSFLLLHLASPWSAVSQFAPSSGCGTRKHPLPLGVKSAWRYVAHAWHRFLSVQAGIMMTESVIVEKIHQALTLPAVVFLLDSTTMMAALPARSCLTVMGTACTSIV
jgi:hypothetical protein